MPSVEDKLGDKLDQDSVLLVANRIKTLTDEAARSANVEKHTLVDAVKTALSVEQEDDGDEEIRQVKAAPKAADFKCPVSQIMMTEPMTNGKCPHLIDGASLKHMFKSRKTTEQLNCPVSGCNQKWTLASATLDIDCQRKIQRLEKQMATQGTQHRDVAPGSQVMDLANDDDDGYTEL